MCCVFKHIQQAHVWRLFIYVLPNTKVVLYSFNIPEDG